MFPIIEADTSKILNQIKEVRNNWGILAGDFASFFSVSFPSSHGT